MSSHMVQSRVPSKPYQRTLTIAGIGGILHAILAIGIRIWSGTPTSLSLSPYILWAILGGVIVGGIITLLYVNYGLVAPLLASLLTLFVSGYVTWGMYHSNGGAVLAAAWTPMTIYVTFWPVIVGVVLVIGGAEWALNRVRTSIR